VEDRIFYIIFITTAKFSSHLCSKFFATITTVITSRCCFRRHPQ